MAGGFPHNVPMRTEAHNHNHEAEPPSLLLTVAEACRFLRVSRTSLYHLMGEGQLTGLRVLGSRRFTRPELEAFVERLGREQREPRAEEAEVEAVAAG